MQANLTHKPEARPHVAVIGGGFTGLSAAYELTRLGLCVTLLEKEAELGGLAGSFEVDGTRLERFYHHWFTSDRYVAELVADLGSEDRVIYRPTRTGMYFANRVYRLSTPFDVLRFGPLGLLDRVRLGLLALRARAVDTWQDLEALTVEEWLTQLGGERVYRVVWEPLLRGKFGALASEISAVWMWNKLKLRGGSRGRGGGEVLAYYRGGFAALAQQMTGAIEDAGGRVETNAGAHALTVAEGRVTGVETALGRVTADAVIATPALPIVADLMAPHVSGDEARRLRRIAYLANVCLALELDRSLSETYWLNVNDAEFPFVGVIEHTNFEPPETYGGRHIVYLSKYLPETDALYRMTDAQALAYCLPYLQRMFPAFSRAWIRRFHVWRARYAQPVVVRHYSRLIPPMETPLAGFYVSSMAQIYPEDRGTNYAIREGRRAARIVAAALGRG